MRKLIFGIFLFCTWALQAQNDEALAALAEIGFSKTDLSGLASGTDHMSSYFYSVSSHTVGEDGKTNTQQYDHDPTKPVGERFILNTVDGRTPTEDEQKAFHKSHNDEDDHVEQQDDDLVKDIWIMSNDENTLKLGMNFNKKKLHHSQKMMKHFTMNLSIDKNTKSLINAQLVSTEPFTMMLVLKVKNMTINIDYTKLENGDHVVRSQSVKMKLAVMGSEASAESTEDYTNYHKPN